MKIIANMKKFVQIIPFALMAVLLVLPSRAFCQKKNQEENADNVLKAAEWLDKNSKEQLKKIIEWQNVKKRLDVARQSKKNKEDEYHKANSEKITKQKERDTFKSHLAEISRDKARQNRDENQMFADYDTAVIILHRGYFDDDSIEARQQALLVYHRAERALFEKYDARSVNSALGMIEKYKTLLPSAYESLSQRLRNYEDETSKLYDILIEAEEKDKEYLNDSLAPNSVERYTHSYFALLQEKLNPTLLDPDAYPYLHSILMEILETKWVDRRITINEQIDNLKIK